MKNILTGAQVDAFLLAMEDELIATLNSDSPDSPFAVVLPDGVTISRTGRFRVQAPFGFLELSAERGTKTISHKIVRVRGFTAGQLITKTRYTLDDRSNVDSLVGGLKLRTANGDRNFELAKGASIIIAPKDGGKSALLKTVLGESETSGIRVDMGEPESATYGSEFEAYYCIALAGLLGATALAFDSFRTVLNEMSGNLQSGGLSRDLDGFATEIDRLAQGCDLTIIATLNPSSVSATAVDTVFNAFAGSVENTIKIGKLGKAPVAGSVEGALTANLTIHSRGGRTHDESDLSLTRAVIKVLQPSDRELEDHSSTAEQIEQHISNF